MILYRHATVEKPRIQYSKTIEADSIIMNCLIILFLLFCSGNNGMCGERSCRDKGCRERCDRDERRGDRCDRERDCRDAVRVERCDRDCDRRNDNRTECCDECDRRERRTDRECVEDCRDQRGARDFRSPWQDFSGSGRNNDVCGCEEK